MPKHRGVPQQRDAEPDEEHHPILTETIRLTGRKRCETVTKQPMTRRTVESEWQLTQEFVAGQCRTPSIGSELCPNTVAYRSSTTQNSPRSLTHHDEDHPPDRQEAVRDLHEAVDDQSDHRVGVAAQLGEFPDADRPVTGPAR